ARERFALARLAGGEKEHHEGADAREGEAEGGEVERQIGVGAIEDGAGKPGTRRRAQAVADAEQPEDWTLVSRSRDPAEQHGDDGRSRAQRQEGGKTRTGREEAAAARP